MLCLSVVATSTLLMMPYSGDVRFCLLLLLLSSFDEVSLLLVDGLVLSCCHWASIGV